MKRPLLIITPAFVFTVPSEGRLYLMLSPPRSRNLRLSLLKTHEPATLGLCQSQGSKRYSFGFQGITPFTGHYPLHGKIPKLPQ